MSALSESRYTEATTTDDDPDCELFAWTDLRANGLVWALNRYILHPRGLALASFTEDVPDDEDHAPKVGWQILRADDGVWSFDTETDLLGRARFDAFMAYVAEREAPR
jgi:hypothetical protein